MIFITPFGLYQPFGSQSGLPSAPPAHGRRRGPTGNLDLIPVACRQLPRLAVGMFCGPLL